MPIYEYRREDGTTFEEIQKFSDEPLEVDPKTGQKVQRVYRAPAIHFKGSGFHNTDYGSKRRPKAGGDESASGASSPGADSGSSSDAPASSVPSDSGSAPAKSGDAAKSGGDGTAKSTAAASK